MHTAFSGFQLGVHPFIVILMHTEFAEKLAIMGFLIKGVKFRVPTGKFLDQFIADDPGRDHHRPIHHIVDIIDQIQHGFELFFMKFRVFAQRQVDEMHTGFRQSLGDFQHFLTAFAITDRIAVISAEETEIAVIAAISRKIDKAVHKDFVSEKALTDLPCFLKQHPGNFFVFVFQQKNKVFSADFVVFNQPFDNLFFSHFMLPSPYLCDHMDKKRPDTYDTRLSIFITDNSVLFWRGVREFHPAA